MSFATSLYAALTDINVPKDQAREVVETFDGTTARFPAALNLINAYENNQIAILKTLVRLKAYVETGARP